MYLRLRQQLLERAGGERDRCDRGSGDQLLVPLGQRQRVERAVEVVAVTGVELAVLGERAEGLARETGPCDQQLDELVGRRLPLHHADVAEERDRMVVEDPVVLRADEARDCRRRHTLEHLIAPEPEQRQVVEQRLVVP